MTGKQKILEVLKKIKRESEINSSSKWVVYRFIFEVQGAEILTDNEERRILMKLDLEKIVRIQISDGTDNQEEEVNSPHDPIQVMQTADCVLVEVLPLFKNKYYWYSLMVLLENKWNYVNPFWIFWQLIKSIFYFIEWIWGKSKITVIIVTLGGFFVYNWTLAWGNLKKILNIFGFDV